MDGKLLCVRLKPYFKKPDRDYDFWCLPGGGVDDNEPVVEAFKREMVEELGIEPKVGRLLYVHQFHRDDDKDTVEFFFHIANPRDYLNVDINSTTHGPAEIEAVDFVDAKAVRVLPKFLSAEELTAFIESDEPVRFVTTY